MSRYHQSNLFVQLLDIQSSTNHREFAWLGHSPPVVTDFVTEEEQGGGERLPQLVFSDQRGVEKTKKNRLCAIKCVEHRHLTLVSNFPTNPETFLVLLWNHNNHHQDVFHPYKINPSSALPLLTANFTLLFHFKANKLDKIQSSDSLRLIHSDLI